MTAGEVADELRVAERTIYRLAGAKQIPAFKAGASFELLKVVFDTWVRYQSIQKGDRRTNVTEAEC